MRAWPRWLFFLVSALGLGVGVSVGVCGLLLGIFFRATVIWNIKLSKVLAYIISRSNNC